MIYTVTLKVLFTTPYGVATEHYNIGNVHEDDMAATLNEAAENGWPLASVRVSFHKSYVDSLVGELA